MAQFYEVEDAIFDAHTLILPIVEMAAQRGVMPDKILKGSKLFYDDLNKQTKRVSFAQLHCVISNTTKLLNADGISFLLAERLFHSLHGNAFQALMHASNLQQMFRISQLTQYELFPYMYAKSYYGNEQVHFVVNFSVCEPCEVVKGFFYELLAGLIECLLKWHFNKPAKRQESHGFHIKFPIAPPNHIEQFHSHLSCHYSFAHPMFIVSVDRAILLNKRDNALPAMTSYYLKQSRLSDYTIGFKQHLAQLITKMPKATSEQIATVMGISSATLKRKLKQHNTSFKMLKDEWQKQQSLIYITAQGYSNEKVAQALAFTDITNFRRAFKRWTGKTPSQLRAETKPFL
ncbi:helix-turn-helix domain-containing protein [Pseudoalteromonas sp. JBTF-M23]|uniref:Helix-turn-helix domain-containing protein n=1 Tax=Pseudoalteromonas caenipelagi TaxID=2726988 RepID=A0A849V961_9GAMM|nr:helix-turn-helix domain-containing protein [Pseudoalteromonas caenipelagi]NOU49173.1 helix-turn-helix domain-containing protein [Pseudoalteromonas caenipelagi]